ncbi:MAG: nucleotidyl transferase AbiEii/AbiGii toxin family protein [Ignavibacteria bacterium]|nr:nucleotidyl transferase AbiEii/AbiGii toxin family protein [Ignavibacteria bacterium]
MKECKEIKNIAASVKERLRNISIQAGKDFQSVLRQYIQERFLFRLSKSIYVNNLILKGALLFIAHDISRSRPTKDIDFLGSSVPNEKEKIVDIIKDILDISYEDGLLFDKAGVKAEDIAEGEEYHGVQVKFYTYLDHSRERVQIDIGFGDHITGGPVEIDFPTLLDFQAPRLKVYSIESAVAEKFEAIVSLQLETSRMKDFYDILYFAEHYEFNKTLLREAIRTTFSQRNTDIEKRKNIYEVKFKSDEQLQKYWVAFLDRNKLTTDINFANIVDKLKSFIEPILLIDL